MADGNWLDNFAEGGRKRSTDGGDVNTIQGDGFSTIQPLPKSPETVPLTQPSAPAQRWTGRLAPPRWNQDNDFGGNGNQTGTVTPPASTTTTAGAPPAPPLTGSKNQYGGTVNLDPAFQRAETIRMWRQRFGGDPTEAQIAEVLKYSGVPDKFSDGQVRVGVNPYWIERIGTGSASADPRLAGTDTLLQNYTGALPEGGGYNGAKGFTSGGATPSITPGQYDDVATNDLLNFAGKRATDLQNMGPAGGFTQYLAQLINASDAAKNSPSYGRLQEMISKAIADTSGDPYSTAQGGALRSGAMDNLTATRDAALENLRREMALKGISPESGVYQQRADDIQRAYEQNKTVMERNLTIDAMNRLDQNRQFGLGAATNALTAENSQQAQVLSLLKEVLGTNLSEEARQQGYLDKALSMFSLPVSIADQRFQDALAASGMSSGNPSNLLQTLATFQSNTQAVNAQNDASKQNLWMNLAALLNQIDWSKFKK
jgi:hypothetical protein